MVSTNRLLTSLGRRRYAILLGSLLGVSVLHPLIYGKTIGQGTYDSLFSVLLIAAIFAVGQKRRPLVLALSFGLPSLVLTWLIYAIAGSAVTGYDPWIIGRYAVHMSFFAVVAAHVLHDVLRADRVTADKLCGAISVYLLLGVIWALIYSTISHLQVEAFTGVWPNSASLDQDVHRYEEFSHLLYYSFVTLTTLGYGDITPISPEARVFTWLEAVVGQLYLAILIAGLVGQHLADSRLMNRRP